MLIHGFQIPAVIDKGLNRKKEKNYVELSDLDYTPAS